jgi:Fic family protein
MTMFREIDHKKQRLDRKRPLPPQTVQSLRDHMLVEWTYHSNAIEGNTLTLAETKVVLEGITIGGKSLKEHLEVINHKEAILYVEDIVRRRESLSEWQIKNIHRLILKGIDDQNAGTYRSVNVLISGARHISPDALLVKDHMEALVRKYGDWQTGKHPVERAALLHIEFVKIHPFVDGNGRTARLLLNFELMKHGYPPIVIENEKRADYYAALDTAHTTGDCTPFLHIVSHQLSKVLDLYLSLV